MPDGVLQWIDLTSGQATIVRSGRVYATSSGDVEPVARHPGARVHFDIQRQAGGERAVDVRLRPGTRVSHHQRRYGTLTGAYRPDTKSGAPFAHAHPERGRELAAHPLEVVREWVDCLLTSDLDTALSLYASDAVLHVGGQQHRGRSQIGAYLAASPLLGIARDAEIRGEERLALARWAEVGLEIRSRVEHGVIAEQWLGTTGVSGRTEQVESGAGSIAVTVLDHGRVDDDDVAYAVERIGAVLRRVNDPVLFVRLKLGVAGDPARAKPALAQVTLDVNGELLRAHVAAHGMREAADLLERRLADKLDERAQHRDDLRTRTGEPQDHEWRHGDLPSERPEYFDRPPDERQLVRHKTFAIDELTVDEAAFDMEQLDYDFHLFRDLVSGEDAVLQRRDAASYQLTRLHPVALPAGAAAIEVDIAHATPPELTVAEALERLGAGGEPFVFFANAATARGNVVYRRYDGHYGLITPA